ncbi:MAG: hypothetical protein AMJ56_19980 [Anaerolineae bacterium SG8_19]|jgi:hypothetical protein|nr:MAG: hypothetical protein AMJ56_19980 [Anaerolineae bacterium SG8_19]HCB50765.1 hypothetical protein [Chloroflexota bacterium]
MEIAIADERALVFQEQLTMDQAEGRAWGHKLDAFGSMEKVTSFLRRPKDEDFKLIYKEHRLQPFWHIECQARYVYERQREYPITLSGPEVAAVTIDDREYPALNDRIVLKAVEHCREEPHREVFIDGYTGEHNQACINYLQYPANEMPIEQIDELTLKGIILVPPQSRATAVLRDVLLGVLKSLQADHIIEDQVEVERVDLYYRPVYAFQYRWLSKEKEAVLEIDGLTGKLQGDGKVYQQYMGQILDAEFLFDVGAETLSLLVPGGGIALKLARKGYNVARSDTNS